jgi:hypothetical protein
MNRQVEAMQDPEWNKAAEIISPNRASEPILLVEGKLDRFVLMEKWQEIHRDASRNIRIQRAGNKKEKGGKEFVLAEFKERRKKDLIFALVDMDHDFEGEKIGFSSSVYDTRPFVTLATHYFPDDDAAKIFIRSVVSEIGGNYGNKLNDQIVESIVRISKVLTWIKLFKGQHIKGGTYHNLKWEKIDNSISSDSEFQKHIYYLQTRDKSMTRSFLRYIEVNAARLETCGINDHSLSDTIWLWLLHCDSKFTYNVKKSIDKIYILTCILEKSSEKDDEFILKLRDNITQK